MKILLLRHAEAEPYDHSDFTRALTAKGEAQAKRAGAFCAEFALIPDLILTSPLVRAEQTARLAAAEMKGVEILVVPWLASGMEPQNAIEELGAFTRFASIMLVGHEPDFSRLACALLGITGSYGINVRKASLTALDADFIREGTAVLDFSLPVKFM